MTLDDGGQRVFTIALAGDVMLGRGVNEAMARRGAEGPSQVWDESLLAVMAEADLRLVNLECALTSHTERWHDGEAKAFYFRAEPALGVAALRAGGVDFVSNANNHARDFGTAGLLETIAQLERAGIAHAGAGADLAEARRPAVLEARGLRVAVTAWADYPLAWAAEPGRPGINYTDVSVATDDFAPIAAALQEARTLSDLVVFSIHWGPNMRERPSAAFREFAHAVIDAGADVFWGHSAHVVQAIGVCGGRPSLFDTGDFLDDYVVDGALRNDLGALFLLRVVDDAVAHVEVVPTVIDGARVGLATGPDFEWFTQRLTALSNEVGTQVRRHDDRLVVELSGTGSAS